MKDRKLQSIIAYASIIILSFLLLVLSGCRTPQKTEVQSNTEIKNDIKEEKRDSVSSVSVSEILRIITEYLNLSVKETNYDTSKPVNPDTGKPPVSSEKETKINSKKETSEKNSTIAKTDSVSVSGRQDNSTINQDVSEKSDVAQDPHRYRYIFGIIILVVIVVLIGWKKIAPVVKRMF